MMVFKNVKISDYNLVLDEIFKKNKSHKLFLLNGEIGSGKTTLIKSFLKRLLVKRGVSSPTFNIINEYSNDNNELFFHFDLYRIKSKNELIEIGFDEYINSGNYCFIEWPEISKVFIDKKFVNITLSLRDHFTRDIKVTYH
tara:strand:+ start:699 stop:1121 length:423 start_codon:yes stop_codon:yes gene_type:complete